MLDIALFIRVCVGVRLCVCVYVLNIFVVLVLVVLIRPSPIVDDAVATGNYDRIIAEC